MCLNIGFFNHRLTKPQPAVMVRWFSEDPILQLIYISHKFEIDFFSLSADDIPIRIKKWSFTFFHPCPLRSSQVFEKTTIQDRHIWKVGREDEGKEE